MVLDDHLWLGRENWEIGGLEHEIPKLLLDRAAGNRGERGLRSWSPSGARILAPGWPSIRS